MPSNKQKRATSKEDMDTTTTTDNADAESVDSQSQNQNKTKRLRSSSSTPTPTKLQQQTLTKQSQKQVQSYIQDLFDIIRSHRTDSSKCPSETFARLPSKRSHAQYYTQIQQPIDLTQIQQKITNATYTNVDEFEADFTLLITNAKTFFKSSKTSVEYKDAQILWDVFEMEKKKRIDIMMSLLDQDEAAVAATTTTTSDQELETTPTKRSSRKTTTKQQQVTVTPLKDESPNETKSLRRQQQQQQPVTTTTVATTQPQETSSQLVSYLEEFFYIMATHKCPDTKRSLAIVFYMLPSNKVSSFFLLMSDFRL